MSQSEQINELAAALAKAAASIENAKLNKINPHYKSRYADLAACLDAIRKPLGANGLAVTQTTEMRENGFTLVTTLAHASGQWIKSEYPLPLAGRPQELGSALTYARRYSLCAITGIAADEDDDAEAASEEKVGNGRVKVKEDKAKDSYITAEQQKLLRTIIEGKGRSVEKFCEIYGAATLANIAASRYSDALTQAQNASARKTGAGENTDG